jgi:hypothetical protein
MFGLTEQEMDLYRDLAQDFAVEHVAPTVKKQSQFMTPVVLKGDKYIPNTVFLGQLLTDIETIVTLTAKDMAYDYAFFQAESDMKEAEIIKHLHEKFESYVLLQFVKYGITFSTDVLSEIVGEIILELPYLYVSAIEDDEFDEDEFLEERLIAYNDYLDKNFTKPEDDDFLEEDIEEEE